MQKDSKIFDDMARLASGAAGGFLEMKRELESMVGAQLEKLLQRMSLVTKEEFDTVQGMLTKSRMEQEELKKRLEALEEKDHTPKAKSSHK
jgi:BMFP domain-containing protein YqiC